MRKWITKYEIAIVILAIWLFGFTCILLSKAGAQEPPRQLTPDQKAEYYRLGSALLYKQLQASEKHVELLEAEAAMKQYAREAVTALDNMARFRERVLGDMRCTIDPLDASVQCPPSQESK